jgi:hypothetical protein
MLSSPRKPAITILTFSSGEYRRRTGAPDISGDLLSFLRVSFYCRSHRSSFAGYDELKILSYSIAPFCLTGADEEHGVQLRLRVLYQPIIEVILPFAREESIIAGLVWKNSLRFRARLFGVAEATVSGHEGSDPDRGLRNRSS